MLHHPRLARALSAASLALVWIGAPRVARADGEDVGLSWADCVVAPKADADLDGLDDTCEYVVASRFQPQLVFGAQETASGRLPFWASKPDGYRTMRIFYALSYFKDAGDPTLGGVSGHDGDTEFVVLRVVNTTGTTWELVNGYLSAHYGTASDSGGWYTADQFEFAGPNLGKPVVYVAEGKHANYISLGDCDSGAFWQDHCADVLREDVGIAKSRDLGLAGAHLVDEHVVNGNSEWFWTDVAFCGWTRPPGDPRKGCVPAANNYSIELTTYEMAYGPVGQTPLCGACVEDVECAGGGVCMVVGADLVCGRECSDAVPCPAGSHCDAIATGESQCVPDVACACVTACAGRECGDDGCGSTCGSCNAMQVCTAAGTCCEGTCWDKACGQDDGCGTPCTDACGSGGSGGGGSPLTGGSGGSLVTGGSGGSPADGGSGGSPGQSGGCGCRAADGGSAGAWPAILLGLAAAARRRRRSIRRPA